jgi:hypothetical protein
VTTPQKYKPTLVGKTILNEVVEQLPTLWTAHFLVERTVSDAKDKREVETAEKALDKLRRSKLIRLGTDELVEPTGAGLDAANSPGST